jgi:ribulose-5-phosphate 4-epimerase/fuculose-1-phosphate aldolase
VHTTATQAVCCLKEGLSFTNFYAAQLYGKIAYHDFEGITVHLDEGLRILDSSQGMPVLLLRSHGPVTIGFNLANAFSLMWLINRACEVQLASQSMGEVLSIPVPVLEKCVRDSLNFDPKFGGGQDAFDALQRIVDRTDPSYRG